MLDLLKASNNFTKIEKLKIHLQAIRLSPYIYAIQILAPEFQLQLRYSFSTMPIFGFVTSVSPFWTFCTSLHTTFTYLLAS